MSRWERLVIALAFVIPTVIAVHANGSAPIEYEREPQEIQEVEPKEIRIEVVYNWDEARTKEEVWEAAKKYKTFPDKMWNTILCENPQLDPKLQSYISADGPNGREDSWGLAQFWLPAKNKTADGRVITKEIAQNPKEAIDAMAYHFSIGNAKLWSCYRKIYL